MKKSEIVLGLLRIPLDYIATLLAFLLAYTLRKNYPDLVPGLSLSTNLEVFQPWDEYLVFSAVASLVLVIVFALQRQYSLRVSSGIQSEFGNVFVYTSSWLILIIAYFFFTREQFFSRLVLAYSFTLTILFVTMGRAFIRSIEQFLLKRNIGRRNMLIIGANSVTSTLYETLGKDRRFKMVGVLSDGKVPQKATYKIIGGIEDLKKIVSRKKIDEIIQTNANLSQTHDILDFCREHHLEYSFVPDLIDIHQKNIDVYPISGIPIIHLRPTPLEGWGKVIKRIFDIVVSFIAIIILSPFLALTAAAIKLDSKGTIMFKYLDDGSIAKRIGQGGKPFRFFKFRSMHPNTHNMRYKELSHLNTRKGTPMVKIKNDPRVTRVGRFIRKTSIDELPQLWNVLKGDLSLVGPRPHLPEEVENYEKHHKFVLTIKPGVSGLAQISGRSDLNFEEEVRLDRYYIENWSIWLDIKIIIKTIFVVIKRSGAED